MALCPLNFPLLIGTLEMVPTIGKNDDQTEHRKEANLVESIVCWGIKIEKKMHFQNQYFNNYFT